jgi:hypothetical protein
MAESARTPPFLPEHNCLKDQGCPNGNRIEASLRWTWVARVTSSLRASLYGILVSTR